MSTELRLALGFARDVRTRRLSGQTLLSVVSSCIAAAFLVFFLASADGHAARLENVTVECANSRAALASF